MRLRLCIDPGHGFSNRRPGVYDPGTVAASVEEADIALAFALSVRWVARQEFSESVEILLTRDDDSDPLPVGTRDDVAEALDADCLVSLHCNAANGHASGSEAYFRDAIDRRLAEAILPAAVAALGARNRGVKNEKESQHSGGLALFGFDGPAALLELEFLDYPPAREKLLRREVRIDFARRLLRAVLAWKAAK